MSDSLKSKLLPPKLVIKQDDYYYRDKKGTYADGYKRALEVCNSVADKYHAEHIEPLFANAVEVGMDAEEFGPRGWSSVSNGDYNTHKALLIGVTPIERGVTVDEIVEALRTGEWTPGSVARLDLADRIKREGIKS